jgi:hypothetical protein
MVVWAQCRLGSPLSWFACWLPPWLVHEALPLLVIAALFIATVNAAVTLLRSMLSSSFPPAVAPVVIQESGSMDVDVEAGGGLLLPFPGNVVDGEHQVVMKKM